MTTKRKMFAPKPRVGQTMDVHGESCRVIVVRPAGTVDVQNERTGKCYRVSGLSF